MKTDTVTFDPAAAKAVAPTRHEKTGRTFCFVQGDELFSATGVHVATDKDAAAAATQPKTQNAKL